MMHTHSGLKKILALTTLISFLAVPGIGVCAPDPGISYRTAGDDVRYLPWPETGNRSLLNEEVVIGSSKVFRFDRDITRVAISDSSICNVVPLGPKEVLVNASQTGTVNLMVWDEDDQIASFGIKSIMNSSELGELLYEIDKNANLRVVPFKNSVAVYGTANTAQKVGQIEQITKSYHEGAMTFVNVEKPKQVLLEVRFAEVDRRHDEEFRLDADLLTRYINYRSTTGQTGASDAGTMREIDGVYPEGSIFDRDGYPHFDSSAVTQSVANLALTYATRSALVTPVLRWFESRNMLKIIARPNLLALDGQKASFLVGGEFAIPVAQDNTVNVEYQKFGTRLDFKPVILDDQKIRLDIDTEVSELDFSNTVTISNTTIPSLLKRQQTTTAELYDGQSLVIGGMITQRINRIHRKVPLLGDLPLIGQAFNSDDFTRTDVELIVVITPHIVEPFEMKDVKRYYDNIEEVEEAVKLIHPPYPDTHGDAINNLITQSEEYSYFDKKMEDKMKEAALKAAPPAALSANMNGGIPVSNIAPGNAQSVVEEV